MCHLQIQYVKHICWRTEVPIRNPNIFIIKNYYLSLVFLIHRMKEQVLNTGIIITITISKIEYQKVW